MYNTLFAEGATKIVVELALVVEGIVDSLLVDGNARLGMPAMTFIWVHYEACMLIVVLGMLGLVQPPIVAIIGIWHAL